MPNELEETAQAPTARETSSATNASSTHKEKTIDPRTEPSQEEKPTKIDDFGKFVGEALHFLKGEKKTPEERVKEKFAQAGHGAIVALTPEEEEAFKRMQGTPERYVPPHPAMATQAEHYPFNIGIALLHIEAGRLREARDFLQREITRQRGL
jgi:hypothetical protein